MRRGTPGVVAALAATVLVGTSALTACSGGSDDKPAAGGPTSTATTSAGTGEVTTQAAVDTVTGNLGASKREALASAVAQVVDGWIDGAYLGDFPRSDYAAAFAGFTPGAAAKAQHDLALMTNSAISDKIDKAEATKRSISLDVLSVKQRPVGVTARVVLGFDTTGTLTGPQEVTGTLDLTPEGGGWKIFGFEITRTQA